MTWRPIEWLKGRLNGTDHEDATAELEMAKENHKKTMQVLVKQRHSLDSTLEELRAIREGLPAVDNGAE